VEERAFCPLTVKEAAVEEGTIHYWKDKKISEFVNRFHAFTRFATAGGVPRQSHRTGASGVQLIALP